MMFQSVIWCLLTLAVCSIALGNAQRLEAELKEDDPTVLENQTLIMNCTITQAFEHYDSSHLFLIFGNEEISEEYLTRPDNLTLTLNITPPVEWSGGHVYCKARGYNTSSGILVTLSHQVLTVLRRPVQPVITGCKVYNWERMVCEWKPSEKEQENRTGMKVEQTLVWLISNHPCRTSPEGCQEDINRCPHLKGPTTCEWIPAGEERSQNYFRSNADYTVAFHVNFTHNPSGLIGILPFHTQDIETKDIVQPNAIVGLDVEPGNWSLVVAWDNKHVGRWMVINVHVQQLSDPDMPILVMNKTQKSAFTISADELQGKYVEWLRPNTRYNVALRQIPYFNSTRVGAFGFWSEFANFTVTTQVDVPGGTPNLTSGLYRRWENGDDVLVEVFWKQLARRYQHGRPKHVLIHYIDTSTDLAMSRDRREVQDGASSSSKMAAGSSRGRYVSTSYHSQLSPSCNCEPHSCKIVNYTDAVTWAELPNLPRSRTYQIYVELENELGCNPALYLDANQTPIVISQKQNSVAAPVHFVARQKGHVGQVELDWDHAPSSKQTPDRYTIYWCRTESQDNFKECIEELQWIDLPGNTTHYQFEDLKPQLNYAFGISAERKSGLAYVSSGFQVARCTHDTEKSIKSPANVKFAPPKEQQPDKIKIQWVNPVHCKDSAYIREYEIVYGAVDGEEAKKGSTKKYVDASAESYVITGVKGGQRYRVKMRSVSDRNKSRFVSPSESDTIKVLSSSIQLSNGAIAGIVIGSILCVSLVILGIFSLVRRIKKKLKPKKVEIILPEDNTHNPRRDTHSSSNHAEGDADESQPFMTGIHDAKRHLSSGDYDTQNAINNSKLSSLSTPLLNDSTNCNGLGAHFRAATSCDSAMGESVNSSREPEVNLSLGKPKANNNQALPPVIKPVDPQNKTGTQYKNADQPNSATSPQKKAPASSGSGITSYTVVVDQEQAKKKAQPSIKESEDTTGAPETEKCGHIGEVNVTSPQSPQHPMVVNRNGYVDNNQFEVPSYVRNDEFDNISSGEMQRDTSVSDAPEPFGIEGPPPINTNKIQEKKENPLDKYVPFNSKTDITKATDSNEALSDKGLQKSAELNDKADNAIDGISEDMGPKSVLNVKPNPLDLSNVTDPKETDIPTVKVSNGLNTVDSAINSDNHKLISQNGNDYVPNGGDSSVFPTRAIAPTTTTTPLARAPKQNSPSPVKRNLANSEYVSHSNGHAIGAFSPTTPRIPPDSAAAASPSHNEFTRQHDDDNLDGSSMHSSSASFSPNVNGSRVLAAGTEMTDASSPAASHYRSLQNPGYVDAPPPDQFHAPHSQSMRA